MGAICAKLRHCLGCCCREETPRSAAGTQFKLLLLGVTGSGKTQLGYQLSGKQRDADDREATNGVRWYRHVAQSEVAATGTATTLLLTEVGGSADMQRIWPHYYANCNGLIYCFDLSGSNEELQLSIDLLKSCLQHEAMRGKPVLLVATRHRDGLQLYDVEHAFGLEQLARATACPLHICHATQLDLSWLQRQLHQLAPTLVRRLKYDVNLQSWQQRKRSLLSSGKLKQVHRQRFRRAQRKLWPLPQVADATRSRPQTAPAAIFFVRTTQRPAKP